VNTELSSQHRSCFKGSYVWPCGGALTAAVFPGASEVSQKISICPVQLTTVFSYLYFCFSFILFGWSMTNQLYFLYGGFCELQPGHYL